MTRWVAGFGIVLVSCLASQRAPAQDAVVMQMYGNGVHAYFSGNARDAYDLLTAAISARANDPRALYFRGLALLQMGRPEQARADFDAAAKLEAEDSSQFYDVSRALERVQGRDRLAIERYRTQGRMQALSERQKIRRRRYEELYEDEPSVTIEEEGTAGSPPADSADSKPKPKPSATPAAPVDDGDPFADPAAPGEEMPAEEEPAAESPAAETPAADADPFGTPPAEAPPTDDDPFDSPAAEQPPAEKTPVETPPAEAPPAETPPPGDDPFDSPAAEAAPGDDPFDSPAADEPPAGEMPAADEPNVPDVPPAEAPSVEQPTDETGPPEENDSTQGDAPAEAPSVEQPTEESAPPNN